MRLPTERSVADVHHLVTAGQAQALDSVCEWVRMPSFSASGEGIAATADFTRNLLSRISADAQTIATSGNPVVLGHVGSTVPDAPTLIVYGLYDVTPTLAHEWRVDPMSAEIVDAGVVGLPSGLGPVLVGRGVNNHKGPIAAVIAAVGCMLEAGSLPVNLTFVIEGEEEIGSPSLPEFLAEHPEIKTSADGVWLPCMQQNSSGTMVLRRSFKGSLWLELLCQGDQQDAHHLWSGHSAWMTAPLMRMVRGLATLFDDDQRIAVPTLRNRTPRHQEELAGIADQFDRNPEWERRMLATLGVGQFMHGRRLSAELDHYVNGVTINIQAVDGGYAGPSYYTMMPGWATAKLDVRFPDDVTPAHAKNAIVEHLRSNGFPDLQVAGWRGYPGTSEMGENADTLMAAAKVTAGRLGIPVDVWPRANNCCPASLLSTGDRVIPFSIAGAGYGDRPHAPDEFITVPSVEALMHFTVDYLADWAELLPAGRSDDRIAATAAPAASPATPSPG